MKKLMNILALVALFSLGACNQSADETKSEESQSTETSTQEEKSKLKINVDAENKEAGVENDDVDISLKGEDDKK